MAQRYFPLSLQLILLASSSQVVIYLLEAFHLLQEAVLQVITGMGLFMVCRTQDI